LTEAQASAFSGERSLEHGEVKAQRSNLGSEPAHRHKRVFRLAQRDIRRILLAASELADTQEYKPNVSLGSVTRNSLLRIADPRPSP
jgi:hypothetical protein